MSDNDFLYEKRIPAGHAAGVALLTFNRPSAMNGWNYNMQTDFNDALDKAEADPAVRVIVVTGSGKAFSAGADMDGLLALAKAPLDSPGVSAIHGDRIKERALKEDWPEWRDSKGRAIHHCMNITKPVIGAINGACAGAGFCLALLFDIRFAGAGVKFTSAFARRGLIAEYGSSWTLPRIVGHSNALDIMLSARVFDADEAMRLGLVQRVFPKEQLLNEVMAYAQDLADNCPPASLAVIKWQVNRHNGAPLLQAMRESDKLLYTSVTTKEFLEGVESFLEKRSPKWTPLDADNALMKIVSKL